MRILFGDHPFVLWLLMHIFLQGLEKVIPDTPKGQTPIHLRDWQTFADNRLVLKPNEKDVGVGKDGQDLKKPA